MGKFFGSKIYVQGGAQKERQNLSPLLAAASGCANEGQLFERTVLELLGEINKNRVGRILLEAIDRYRPTFTRYIRIRPDTGELAFAKPVSPAGASPQGHPIKVDGAAASGTGTGSSTDVLFNPGAFSIAGSEDTFRPDDVLFHELVHAYRYLVGRLKPDQRSDGFDDDEEFLAIMLTNIYTSDAGRKNALRGSHKLDFETLGQTQSSFGAHPHVFYIVNRQEIDRFCTEEPDIANPIANLKDPVAAWNPIRERAKVLAGPFAGNPSGTSIEDRAGGLRLSR